MIARTVRAGLGSLCLFAVALAALAPRAARGSAADAFENKVKPVSGQLYTKAGKLELTPTGALSLNDAFFTKYMGGLKLDYHLSEYFSFGVTGLFGSTGTTGSTSVCPTNQPCRNASQNQLNQVPGEIKWVGGAEVAFAPIYGKLNVFAEKALHFDLSILGGLDLVNYRDVAAPETGSGSPGNVSTPGIHGGLGARVFLARSVALRLEVKDFIYRVKALDRGNWQSQLFAEAGLSFFIPVADRDQQ
jgi:outer membrane beta-barrel protein